jgi:SAM-dependent methyltransferase
MRSADWDARYAASDLVWSAGPNVFVEQICADLPPGRALDVAGGEGRNALWLADHGWEATIADWSQVALDRAARLWDHRDEDGTHPGRVHVRRVDVVHDDLGHQDQDLVVVCYLQVPADERRAAHASAARAVAPGGQLVVVAHHSDNLAQGHGGPQDPAVLFTEDDVTSDIDGLGLQVLRSAREARHVQTPEGSRTAWDAVVVAQRL